MLSRTNTELVETVLCAETILSATDLCGENSLLWLAWFCRALTQTGAALSSFEGTTLATSLLFAPLGPLMFGISRAKFAPNWMALAAAIFRSSPKLSLRSSCTPKYLMLLLHSTSCSPKTILGYWKDLLSVTSKASVFSWTIIRHLLSNQRFTCHRLSLILSSRIPTSSAAHTHTRHLHPNEPRVGLQKIADAQIGATNKDAGPP